MNGSQENKKNQKPVLNVGHHIGIENEGLKYCPKCKTNKSKDKFHKDRGRSDGIAGICKKCKSAHYKEVRKKTYLKNKETNEFHYSQPLKIRSKTKYECYNVFNKYLRKGAIKIRPCRECGTWTDLDAHHDDYSKPLDVVWLCRRHHRLLHLNKKNN